MIAPSWIGIDISKAWLNIADPAPGRADRVANCEPAITAFARTLTEAARYFAREPE